MAGPSTTVRCPSCGQPLRAVLAAAPSTQWFPCPHCHRPVPALLPTSPPPLYTWEVVPGLYPTLPFPRPPRWKASTVAAGGLVAITVLAVLLSGALAYYGWQASAPEAFTVSGTVESLPSSGPPQPVAFALVVLHGEGGFSSSAHTGAGGTFAFAGVPSGGVNLTVTAAGYDNATLTTLITPVYDAGSTGLVIDLTPSSGPRTTTATTLSPFPDLESFLANVGAGALVFALAAIVAAGAAVVVSRPNGPVLGVLGAGAGVGVPAVAYLISLASPFPLLALATAATGGCGAFVLAVEAAAIARRPREAA